MSSFSQPVDIYCERLDPSFWGEPLNAISNTAFILAGIFALGLLRRNNLKNLHVTILGILTITVGIGSFIFHTIATRGAILADDIPIVCFIFYALYVIFMQVFHLKPLASLLSVIAFAIANAAILMTFGMHLFNGSIMYAPSLFILLFISIYSTLKKQTFARYFLISALAFLCSIIFRSIDKMVCPFFPLGTHFMWHILNAVTMYYAMLAVIRFQVSVDRNQNL